LDVRCPRVQSRQGFPHAQQQNRHRSSEYERNDQHRIPGGFSAGIISPSNLMSDTNRRRHSQRVRNHKSESVDIGSNRVRRDGGLAEAAQANRNEGKNAPFDECRETDRKPYPGNLDHLFKVRDQRSSKEVTWQEILPPHHNRHRGRRTPIHDRGSDTTTDATHFWRS